MKYSLYLVSKFMCTLTHNSPRCSLLRNGAQTDCRNTSSALCYPWRSLRSPSQPKPRLSAQLTRQHREGPLPFSGLFGQHAHGWRRQLAAATESPAASSFCCSSTPSSARGRHTAGRQHRTAPPRTYSCGDSLRVATSSSAPAYRARGSLQRTGLTGPMHALA